MNAPWWSDGLRIVMQLSDRPVPLEEQNFFFWDWALEEAELVNEKLSELMGE